MRTGGVHLVRLVVGVVIPRLTLPVDGMDGRIVIQSLPPDRIGIGIQAHVGKDGVLHAGVQCVGVGLLVGAGCNSEEAVLRVDSPQATVTADTQPCNIIPDRLDLVALLLEHLRRNQHGEVGLAAGRRESSGHVLLGAVRVGNAQDQHMLRHPAFLPSEVGRNAQGEALLAQQDISAVVGVDGPDGVILREVNDIAVLGVQRCLGMQTLDKVAGITQRLQHVEADAGHNLHVQHNIDGVRQLDAVLGKGGADNGHGVRDDVHGTSLHAPGVQLGQLSTALGRIHPVIDVSGILLGLGADEGTPLHARHVVPGGTVQVAARQLFLVELDDLAAGKCLLAERGNLFLASVNPDDVVRLGHGCHLIQPVQHVLIVCRIHFEIPPYFGVSFGRQSGVSIPKNQIPVKRPSLPSMYFTPLLVNLQGGKGKGYKIFTRVLQFQPICSYLEGGCIRALKFFRKKFCSPP